MSTYFIRSVFCRFLNYTDPELHSRIAMTIPYSFSKAVFTVLACLVGFVPSMQAATIYFSGAFTADWDVQFVDLTLNSDGVIDARTLSYGGWSSPFVSAGGFAPALALYDRNTGALQQSDTTGGTAIGGGCSNGATQDQSTGFCQDATISFNAVAGNYVLALTVQPNSPPAFLSDPFSLLPGDNFPGGPFADPGDPTGLTRRNGNWVLQVSLNGTADTAVPEPSTLLTGAFGLLAVTFAVRRSRN
jgi:hypothetical protein